MIPALAAYLGQAGLGSIDRYLKLTPNRFAEQVRLLSPGRMLTHWRDDPALLNFLAAL
jgi:hypothetical protein